MSVDFCLEFEKINEPKLPYDSFSVLMPYICPNTLFFHFEKHHKTYQKNLETLIASKASYAKLSLKEIVQKSYKDKDAGVFNNAAQVWNHNFYWYSMKPNGGGIPTGKLLDQINKDFGSYDAFKKEFTENGKTQFGSGWVWLVFDKKAKKLVVQKTPNAETPVVDNNFVPLMTCDVWEHAYYLDYQNRRVDYLAVFIDHLVNWDFASCRFSHCI